MTVCRATDEDHCCWVGGEVCAHYLPNEPLGLRCALMAELGSWSEVHVDPRYPASLTAAGIECGNWPRPGQTCGDCGEVG